MYSLLRLSSVMGVEVKNFDLKTQLGEHNIVDFKKLIYSNKLVVFRNQRLSSQEQIEICRLLGKIIPHPLKKSLSENKEITVVSNVNELGHFSKQLGPDFYLWHIDLCYNKIIPTLTCIYAEQVPSQGGNTLFADTNKAYNDLDQSTQKTLCEYHAIFSFSGKLIKRCKQRDYVLKIDDCDKKPDCIHPVIIVHPVTKLPSILVNWAYTDKIIELSQKDSDRLLADLYRHYTQVNYIYSHQYQQNDLIFWDNNALVHTSDSLTPVDGPRIVRRVVIE